jgi:hypothetical protein
MYCMARLLKPNIHWHSLAVVSSHRGPTTGRNYLKRNVPRCYAPTSESPCQQILAHGPHNLNGTELLERKQGRHNGHVYELIVWVPWHRVSKQNVGVQGCLNYIRCSTTWKWNNNTDPLADETRRLPPSLEQSHDHECSNVQVDA